jgi:hypothetical protein
MAGERGPVPPHDAEPAADPRVRADVPGALQLDVDALFERVAAETVDKRASALERMRQWSTGRRRLALGAALLVVGLLMLTKQGLRPDLGEHGSLLGPPLAVLLGAAALGLGRALRPMHLPPVAMPWLVPALLVSACVLSVLLGAWPGMPITPEPAQLVHLGCGLATGLASASVATGAWALDRGAGLAAWRVATASAAAALAAFVLQTLVCPVVELEHMVLGHTGPGLLVIGIALVIRALRASR